MDESTNITNAQLVSEYQNTHDMNVLLSLFQRNAGLVRKAVRKYLPQYAEDGLQEAFLATMAAAKTYRSDAGTQFATWLWTWLRAYLLRYRRSDPPVDARIVSLDRPLVDDADNTTTLSDLIPGTDDTDAEVTDQLEEDQFTRFLVDLLATIAGGDIIRQHDLDGLPLARIATMNGETVASATARRRSALHTLRSPQMQRRIAAMLPERWTYLCGSR